MENEKRLIDANALKKKFDERLAEDIEMFSCHIVECFPADDANEIVDKMPAVDAVEVVRCCSCEQHDHDGAEGYCWQWDKWTKMSDFCSYGRKGKTMSNTREKMKSLLMQKGFGVEGATIAADHLIANGVTIPVRCKDCKYGQLEPEEYVGAYRCLLKDWDFNDGDFFCVYGTRRADDGK